MVKKKILSVLFSSSLITVFNYAIIFLAGKYLDEEIFGFFVYIQSFVFLVANISYVGINFEILRYANKDNIINKEYGINKNRLIVAVIIISLSSLYLLLFSERIENPFFILIIFCIQILYFIIIILSSYYRVFNYYTISNFLDKSVMIGIAFSYSWLLIINDNIYYALFFLLFIIVLLVFLPALFLGKKYNFGILLNVKANKIVKNTSLQLYITSLLPIAANGVERIVIGEKLALEVLALWYIYFQTFLPYPFFARAIKQVLFTEIAQGRFRVTVKKFFFYILLSLFVTIIIFIGMSLFMPWYYSDKYDLNIMAILGLSIVGFVYMIFMFLDTYISSKMSNKILFSRNLINIVLTSLLFLSYIFLIDLFFPVVLIVLLILYWFIRVIICMTIILKKKKIVFGSK